jgi:hypothetical protein
MCEVTTELRYFISEQAPQIKYQCGDTGINKDMW